MAISEKAKTRILKLCSFMEALPKSAVKHFDMNYILEHEGDHKHRFPAKLSMRDLHKCGTVACALGWAATMPYFKRLGLSLNADAEVDGDEIEVFDLKNISSIVKYGAWTELFGADNSDPTPKAWAKRVRGLVRSWSTK